MPVVHIIGALWAVLIIYWTISAFGNKKAKIRQTLKSRLAYILVLGTTGYALAKSTFDYQLLPINAITQTIGVLLCAAGVAFAIWSRRTLGRNWSGFVIIKENHELIQHGPYRFVRHPIYTGLILAFTGTVLALIPTVKGFLIALVWFLAFYIKAQHEEYVLTYEFGEDYEDYKRRVKSALIPFGW